MPRKVFHGVDYDDKYDAYEDEEYDYDYEYENDYNYEEKIDVGKAPDIKAKQEKAKTAIWSCPICTYDNEDTLSACEICGVLRNPLVKAKGSNNTSAVDGACKDFGLSMMAKSLFTSSPSRLLPKKSLRAKNGVNSNEDCFLLRDHGNFQELSRAFSIPNYHKFIIAPFTFGAPSPDDLVSNGLQSGKFSAKVDFLKSLSLADNIPNKETEILIESEVPAEVSKSAVSVSNAEKVMPGNKNKPKASNAMSGRTENQEREIPIKSGNADVVNEGKSASVSEYKPEAWMIPNKEDGLNQLNLAIVGHVDSGKSTLSGRLLHLLGRVSPKQMHKNEKEAKQQGKGSFAYAWALDESAEERERGVTMNVAVAYFTSKNYHVVILDSPGHRDFVPNMISGATQADAAILVVDASVGSFEAGIEVGVGAIGGQTREHAQLIRSFGVDQLVVLVNKMDVVKYSEERFDVIKQKLGTCLRSCGFKDPSISWVPASAMENQNLVSNPSDARFNWFKGPYLLEAIDSLSLPARDYAKPLLMPIVDFVRSQSQQAQVSACGKLETGAIRAGTKVLIMPSGEIATIRSLEKDSKACNIARAGDNVNVSLQGIEAHHVTAGGVMCHPNYPVQFSNHLELKILVLDTSAPILIGSQLEFYIHHVKEAATVVKIVSLLDPKTGKVTKKSPRCLLAKQNAVVEVILQESVCVEEYSKCRALGRVSLRAMGRTVALGVVTRVITE